MPVIGLLLGRGLSDTFGAQAHLVGGALLAATGAYAVIEAARARGERASEIAQAPAAAVAGPGRLLLLAAALSIDNLIVGFALGAGGAPIALAVVLIATISVGLSLLGLELGARLGRRVGDLSALLGGIVLICVGAAIAADLL